MSLFDILIAKNSGGSTAQFPEAAIEVPKRVSMLYVIKIKMPISIHFQFNLYHISISEHVAPYSNLLNQF